MKSSSTLFPVSLLRADMIGDINEDVYLVKHNQDSDRTVEVAVSHLNLRDKKAHLGSVVLVHGSFSNRSFWLSNKGEGLARHLLEQGFDVWLFEHRSHGDSVRNKDFRNNTVERYVRFDLPAVNDFVHEQSGQFPAWIGHSLGGVMIATAVACNLLRKDNCKAIVLLGTQTLKRPSYLWIPFMGTYLKIKARRTGEMDGRAMGIGPENEPYGVIREFVRRYKLFGGWRVHQPKQKLLPAWKAMQHIPLLAVAGKLDEVDAGKACVKFAQMYGGKKDIIFLAKEQGFSQDYGHVDMVVSKAAAQEVWPRISAWLTQSKH